MADKIVKITFEIDGLEKSVSSVSELETALKDVDQQSAKTEKSVNKVADAAEDVGKKSEEAGKNAEGATKIIDEAFGGLGTKVKEVGGGIKQLGTSAISSFKSAVMGASAMGKALIATGIGAIVVALGLIAVYWDDIVGAISGVSADQKQLLADTEATVEANQASLAAISESENSLKLSGKTEAEIRDLKIQQTDETIAAMETQLTMQKEQSDAQVKALQRNKDIAQAVIGFLLAPISMLLGAVDALTDGLARVGVLEEGTSFLQDFTGGIAGMIFDPEAAKEEGAATATEIDAQLRKLKNTRDGYILQGKKENKDAANATIQTERELIDELNRLRAENIKDEEQRALALLAIEREKARKTLVDKGASTALLLAFDKNYTDKAQAIKDAAQKVRDEKQDAEDKRYLDNRAIINEALAQAELDSIDNTLDRAMAELAIQRDADLQKLEDAEATEDEVNRIKKSYVEKAKKLAKDEEDYKKALRKQNIDDALAGTSKMLGDANKLIGEGMAGYKEIAQAQNAIDTYASATAAYKSVAGIPGVGAVLAPLAAAAAIAAGLANAKAIAKVKAPGMEGGGAGANISVPTGPTFDPTQATRTVEAGNNVVTTDAQSAAGNGQTIIKAYVVSSDVTSQQEADAKIKGLSRL